MAILSGESAVKSRPMEWSLFKLLNDKIDDETASDEVDIRNSRAITLFVETGSVVNGGVVKLETAVTAGGPYFVAGSVTTAASTTGYAITLSGGDDGFPAKFARCRIETVIAGGGSIDAYLVVQK